MVKGTEMGYRNFLLAEIGHWQPLQQANKDTTVNDASCLYIANKQ
jgi:hypothetical protein